MGARDTVGPHTDKWSTLAALALLLVLLLPVISMTDDLVAMAAPLEDDHPVRRGEMPLLHLDQIPAAPLDIVALVALLLFGLAFLATRLSRLIPVSYPATLASWFRPRLWRCVPLLRPCSPRSLRSLSRKPGKASIRAPPSAFNLKVRYDTESPSCPRRRIVFHGVRPRGTDCPSPRLSQATAPLTLQQAVARALAANPTLASVRQHVSAVEANKITAGLRQNPTLSLYGQGITLPERPDTPDGNPFFYSANVSRLFERGQKRRWRLDSANATAGSTQSLYRDQERQTVLSVRQAFTNMLLAKASLVVANENLADYRKTVDLSKARLDAGDITPTDFARIDLQLAQFEADADNAQLALQQASTQLQLLFGVDRPSSTLEITGTLEPPQIPLTMAEAENQALAARPDFLAARQALTAAEANANLANANGTTDPTLGAEYDRNGIDNSFGLQLSIPVRIFDRNQGEKNARGTRSNPAAQPSLQHAIRLSPTWTRHGWRSRPRGTSQSATTATTSTRHNTFATTCSSAIATATPRCSTISLRSAIIARFISRA